MITTASSPVKTGFRRNRLLQALVLLYAVIWVMAAIEPLYWSDWLLENLLIFAFGILIVATYRRLPLSDLSYLLIMIFAALHTLGSHYTYAETPVGFWMQEAFGFARNHYDRVVHCSFGLLIAYPLREVLLRLAQLREPWVSLFALAAIMAMSESYEILEWLVVAVLHPEIGIAFLGTQGDPFDAQKDSGLAALGALATLGMMLILRRRN